MYGSHTRAGCGTKCKEFGKNRLKFTLPTGAVGQNRIGTRQLCKVITLYREQRWAKVEDLEKHVATFMAITREWAD